MKKILALILALAMLLSLGACSKRPATAPDSSAAQSSAEVPETELPETESPEVPPDAEPEALPESEPQQAETPEAQPEQTPEETPADTPEETPEAQPEETPEAQPEETPEVSDSPEDNANSGKVDSSATVASTATDLAPADNSFLALIPELPLENWASTTLDDSSIMLELRGVGADAQSALMEYIQTLRDEDFDVTEYSYGSLYEASKDGVTVTLMLEGGTFTVIIEKV